MSHKHQVIAYLIVALSLVLVLPVSNLVDSVMHRDPKQDTPLKIARSLLSEERLFSTDAVQGWMRYQAWQRLEWSLDEGQVVVGRHGFLFLGNDFNAVLDKATGRYPIVPVEVDRWSQGLANLRQWYEGQGMPFVMAVAPNKHTIYPDKLPGHATVADKTITDYLIEVAAQRGVPMLDLREALRAAGREQMLYYKTDTHWNRRAAGRAYQALISFASAQTGLSIESVPVALVPGRTGPGDLTRLLKVDRFLPVDLEEDPRYDLGPVPGCMGELDLTQAGLGPCKVTDRPQPVLKQAGQYVKSTQAMNPLRVLVLSDSFGNLQTELIARTFSTVWFVHWVYVDPLELAAFARAMKPDLVIYQVVERDLFHDKLIKALPNQ